MKPKLGKTEQEIQRVMAHNYYYAKGEAARKKLIAFIKRPFTRQKKGVK